MNLNKVFIIGRITADPQLRSTAGGASVTSFSVATNRMWIDKAGGKQNETEFHNVVAWGRTAEIAAQYLKKGSEVYVEGRLQTRSWQDKQGQPRKTTEIITERLQLGARPSGGNQGFGEGRQSSGFAHTPQAAPAEEVPTIDIEAESGVKEEDLPF